MCSRWSRLASRALVGLSFAGMDIHHAIIPDRAPRSKITIVVCRRAWCPVMGCKCTVGSSKKDLQQYYSINVY